MSLTKKALLENMMKASDPPHKLGEFFGSTVYCKKMSELKRTRRAVSMFDGEEISDKYRERARVLTIIDHLCDEEGKMLFTEKDIPSLMDVQSDVLDDLTDAIAKWVQDEEGND